MIHTVQGAPGTTPGPWRAVGWSPRECDIRATVGGKSAQVCGPANTADAHQIAASPLLYEACEAFIERFQHDGRADTDYVLERVRCALAAARGETA